MSFIENDAVDMGTDVSAEPAQPELSSHAQQFLQDVPEEHRPIIDQHLRKWDSGFTKYSQGVQNELKQYKELGAAEELRQARELYNQFVNDPGSIAEFLITNGYYSAPAPQAQPEQPQIPEEVASYLKPFEEKFSKFDQIERAVSVMASQFQAQAAAQKQKEEDAALEAEISRLKNEHGDFDMEFVITKAQANGGNLEAAVQAYKKFEQNLINRGNAAPRVLGANSLPPITKTPAEMSGDERKQLMIAKLQGLSQG